MKLAIGIITTDRVETLSGTLVSLFLQSKKDWDLYIFDNGELPAIADYSISNLMDLHNKNRKVIYERIREIKEVPKAKKYLLQNLKERGYEFVMISDDDNIFEVEYVKKIYDTFINEKLDIVEGVHVLINNANKHPDYSFKTFNRIEGNEFSFRHFLYNFDIKVETNFADYSCSMYRIKNIDLNLLDNIGGLAGGGYLISKNKKSALRTKAICYETNKKDGSNWRKLTLESQKYVLGKDLFKGKYIGG